MNKRKFAILIVDDNKMFVERIIGMLEKIENIKMINVAADFDEANRILESQKHNLVILDINLPGKNGIELLKQIKSSDHPCEVIMLTNHADDFYRQQCISLGAKYFLDKSQDFFIVPHIVGDHCLN